MSKSFMSAIRGVVNAINEGAKDKTADGMTKDAAHFRKDLHTIQDSGMKHLVQKDSETKDYEKMFSGDVDKAPANRSSYTPGEDLNKYVEYNEHVEIEEAKKAAKEERGCSKDCDCDDCSSEEVKEAWYNPFSWSMTGPAGSPGKPKVAQTTNSSGAGAMFNPTSPRYNPNNPSNVKSPAQGLKDRGKMDAMAASKKPDPNNLKGPFPGKKIDIAKIPGGRGVVPFNSAGARGYKPNLTQPPKAPEAGNTNPGVSNLNAGKPAYKPPPAAQTSGPNKGLDQSGVDKAKPAAQTSGPNRGLAQKPAAKPPVSSAPATKKPATKPPVSSKPVTKKPAAPASAAPAAKPKKLTPLQQQMKRSKAGRDAVAGPSNQMSSYEFEINGTSYLVSEAHASAIAAFVEKYGMVNEGTAGDFIKKEMEHPEKLTAKGKKQKIKQALAIYYSKKRRGENP